MKANVHRTTYKAQTYEDEVIARNFTLQEKVKSALNYLLSRTSGVLQLDDLIPEASSNSETLMHSTRKILNNKHPKGEVPPSSIIVDGSQ